MDSLKTDSKKFRVLYVENDEIVREKLGNFLKRKFLEVELCEDGFEGFVSFQEAIKNHKKFDLIISDISMPKMTGIEMLEKIKKIDPDIFCIFITAKLESELMIDVIHLQIQDYILKPIDFEVLDGRLQVICKDIFYKKKYESQKAEIENYIDILNQEALVVKTNLDGEITFVNKGFCEVSGYSEEELVGSGFDFIKHPDVSKNFFLNMWKTIKKGESWTGIYKNLAKNGTTYFINSKILPVFDISGENVTEYISISFLVTELELEKRKSYKKYLEQVSTYKKALTVINKEKEEFKKSLDELRSAYRILDDKHKQTEQKRKDLNQQLSSYEKNNLELNKIDLMMKKDKSKQFEEMFNSLVFFKGRSSALEEELKKLQKMYENKLEELDNFISREMEHNRRILDLKDLVSNLQEENKKLKEELHHK